MNAVYKYTNAANYSLRVSMEDQGGNQAEVVYQNFKLDLPVMPEKMHDFRFFFNEQMQKSVNPKSSFKMPKIKLKLLVLKIPICWAKNNFMKT